MRKKRWIALLLLAASLLCLCSFDASQQKVYDGADLLDADEEAEIQEKAVELAQKLQMDVILVTTEDTGGLTTSQYNEDFYNSHDFGYEGPGGSGVQFLIDMEHRQYYLLTAGIGDTEYTDGEIEEMYDHIAPAMGDGDYAEACRLFLEAAEEYGMPEPPVGLKDVLILLLGSAVIAAIVVGILVWQNKKQAEGSWRRGYMGSRVHMNRQEDRFIHTTVVRTRIPKPQDNGGGHRSGGGGGSHGGGGGHSRGGGRSF